MSESLGLGKIITTPQQRDATHIAVAPVVAKTSLEPGQHVDANGDPCGTHIGIVDPFLTGEVRKGETFWLFLYPETVTGMRHHWIHPSFDGDKAMAEEWLKEYAARVSPYAAENGKEAAYRNFMEHVEDGEIFYYGTDCHGLYDVEDSYKLFENLSIVLGHSVNGESFTYSCSC